MKISVVIPNYNGEKLLEKNLPLVIKYSPRAEIIVVDDASSDGSAELIEKNFSQIRLIKRMKNEGFASCVNDGVASASNGLVMLLNSDVIPKKNYLSPLIKHFADPKVFAVGSLQHSIGPDGKKIQGRGIGKFEKGFLIHGPGSMYKNNTLWVFAGAGMYRKDIWGKLGGLSTIYNPFYWEDIDISYRALKAGYKLYFEHNSEVIHNHNKGSVHDNYLPDSVRTISLRNQILFVWLNITDRTMLAEHLINLPIYIISYTLAGDYAFVKGLIYALKLIPKAFILRRINKEIFKKTDRETLSNFRV